MSPPGPPPQLFKDRIVHGVEGFAACAEAVIGRPSSDDWVELHNQLSGRAIPVFLDDPSDLLQECFHILLCGSRQDRSAPVLAYVLPKEVETVLDMGDDRFLLRDGKTSLFHESFNEWLDLLFEKLFLSSCHNKVICISCQIDFRA